MSVVNQQTLGYVEKRNYIRFVISSILARSRIAQFSGGEVRSAGFGEAPQQAVL